MAAAANDGEIVELEKNFWVSVYIKGDHRGKNFKSQVSADG
jgi:hypothetical protein